MKTPLEGPRRATSCRIQPSSHTIGRPMTSSFDGEKKDLPSPMFDRVLQRTRYLEERGRKKKGKRKEKCRFARSRRAKERKKSNRRILIEGREKIDGGIWVEILPNSGNQRKRVQDAHVALVEYTYSGPCKWSGNV